MAVKRAAQKSRKKSGKNKAVPLKISLPAFGLAEEILGGRASEPKDAGRASAQDRELKDLVSPSYDHHPVTQDIGSELHLVTFHLDREEFGVEIGSVQEIIRVGQITAVPNSPEFIQGVINLRGRVIPVLNLRRRLNLPDGQLTKNSRIMVVECGKKVLGMLVDGVSQVIRIPAASVDEPPGEVDQARAYVKGIGKVDSRLIMLMDLDKALAKDAQLAQAVG